MKYLVLECHPGYAVVLDERGRFLKAANLNYEVGQTLSSVVLLKDTPVPLFRPYSKSIVSGIAAAACLCLVSFGSWQYLTTPYGIIHFTVNPDVQFTVNRFDYVMDIEGRNPDGERLIHGYRHNWKKAMRVSEELADLAREMDYLSDGGTITLTVESEHESWRTATEEKIIQDLDQYVGEFITVVNVPPENEPDDEKIKEQNELPVEPNPAASPVITSEFEHTSQGDDDWDDDDNDDGDDSWDDDQDDDVGDDSWDDEQDNDDGDDSWDDDQDDDVGDDSWDDEQDNDDGDDSWDDGQDDDDGDDSWDDGQDDDDDDDDDDD